MEIQLNKDGTSKELDDKYRNWILSIEGQEFLTRASFNDYSFVFDWQGDPTIYKFQMRVAHDHWNRDYAGLPWDWEHNTTVLLFQLGG